MKKKSENKNTFQMRYKFRIVDGKKGYRISVPSLFDWFTRISARFEKSPKIRQHVLIINMLQ